MGYFAAKAAMMKLGHYDNVNGTKLIRTRQMIMPIMIARGSRLSRCSWSL
jgi:hypothetical protein